MNPNLKWKALFILAVILFCLYFLFGYPTFPTSLAQVKENFSKQIKLGLDLQGGTHLILQVQVQEAVAQETDTTVDRITTALRNKNVHYDEVRRADDTHILVRNIDPSQYSVLSDIVGTQYSNVWDMAPAAGETNSYTLTLRPGAIAAIQEQTVTQSLETIAQRINALGLTEPTIQLHGRKDNEILVQLPGVGDPAEAIRVIQAGGQLELRLVEDPATYPSVAAYMAQHTVLPAGTELLPGRSENRTSSGASDTGEVWYVVSRAPIVTGRDLRSAVETRNTTNPGTWQVNFTLSPEAARRFGPFTQQNIGRNMAIVLDHKVNSAPVINGRIDDSGMIEGNFSQESAHELALVLRAGALPASIKYLEERTVGPSLGADSIRHGVQASVLSLIVVMLFMLVYYRLSGGNAVLALILNLVILLAVLALFGAVLTLPGIAGVILTIGMGVDSNVLVFERVREEIRNGKSAPAAVDAGFDKAFLTIIDTHVTTVVSAFFLFLFGTGPIRGFAITLTIGLIANVFTAIYVSKAIFHYHLTKMDRQAELSI
ncbi:MAG: protein translocase subunit SecD [Acidobacteria bacterium]|nr:MAG: protein-export membrane protein SecD [Acidobacteria bacterium 13_1_40CM_4_58_4]PYT59936.1 MAG: protein translocase subunit SecD [Acidobacteriota bacterium]